MEQNLWVEKYRPKTVEELILPDRLQNVIDAFVDSGFTQNLIFYGPAGTVKTTTAKCLINTLGAESIFINVSLDSGKSNVHETILPFATGISMENPDVPKIVLMDEFERATSQTQDSLKSLFEQVHETTRFIMTTNSLPKIIEPLRSRCLTLDFSIRKDERKSVIIKLYKKIVSILNENEIPLEDPTSLQKFIASTFPDYRKIINHIQCYSLSYKKIDSGIYASGLTEDAAIALITPLKQKKFDAVRKFISETHYTSDEIIQSLYKNISEFDRKYIPTIIIILAEYQYKNVFVANPQLNCLAMCAEIMGAFNE